MKIEPGTGTVIVFLTVRGASHFRATSVSCKLNLASGL
jgi:hypothetical protein